MGGSLFVSPAGVWSETPKNTTGTNPTDDLPVSWGVFVESIGPRWGTRLEYRGRYRQVRYSGTSVANLDPVASDVRVSEFFNGAIISVVWGR